MPNRAPRRALRGSASSNRYAGRTPATVRQPRRGRSRVLWLALAGGTLLLVGAVAVALVLRGRDDGAASSPAAVATPPRRPAAIDQRLATRDGATDVGEYTRLLDSIESKLRQSGDAVATCAEAGATELSRRGTPATTLDLLRRMDSLSQPQPANQPSQYALTCRDLIQVIVGTGG